MEGQRLVSNGFQRQLTRLLFNQRWTAHKCIQLHSYDLSVLVTLTLT